jgi:diaminohydroxyphosphoribosylaminopyrimidine deaminase/5-amino-6-(5-phosphoribosylamino)uracil reductase
MQDPNPAVSGRGFARLRDAGIEVTVGVREGEARKLNEGFAKWIRTGLPFVTLKSAVSREGFIAPLDRTRTQLTGEAAMAKVQELRHAHDAILVGVGTVLTDDPLLTDRSGKPRRRHLMRVVLDSRLRILLTSKLVTSVADDVLIFCCYEDSMHRRELQDRGVRVVVVPESNGVVDLHAVLSHLGREKILSLMVEGGAGVNRGMLEVSLVDRVFLFTSPKSISKGLHWTGGARFDEAGALERMQYQFSDDTATEFYLHDAYALQNS